jgi:hypothetical protein
MIRFSWTDLGRLKRHNTAAFQGGLEKLKAIRGDYV